MRESVQAKMRMTIKRLLKKYGYPPDKRDKAIDIVMEQTKLMCSNEVTYGTGDRDNSVADRVAEEKGKY
ncbi:MAG: DUF3387 domain-containing protein [Bacilli bacterium]|nr:DUF3387 domain-containing protein [Bacilli bacterium]